MIKRTALLPYPPSTNTLWRYSKRGVYRTAKYMAYIAECKALQVHQGPALDAPVRMEVLACPPDRRRRDLDNLSKSLCDVAVHLGLIEDDHWIHDLHMKWDRESVAQGVLLTITPISAPPVTEKA